MVNNQAKTIDYTDIFLISYENIIYLHYYLGPRMFITRISSNSKVG